MRIGEFFMGVQISNGTDQRSTMLYPTSTFLQLPVFDFFTSILAQTVLTYHALETDKQLTNR